jgi:hypothetical protein
MGFKVASRDFEPLRFVEQLSGLALDPQVRAAWTDFGFGRCSVCQLLGRILAMGSRKNRRVRAPASASQGSRA